VFEEYCLDGKAGKLSDVVEVCYGKDHKKLSDGIIPCYGSGGLMRYVNSFLFSGESVLIPRKGTLNNVLYVNEEFWTVDTMFYTKTLVPNVAKFVYFTINSLDLAGMNVGSAVPSMTTAVLNELEITIPSEKTLAVFEQCVKPLFLQIKANSKDSKLLTKSRDSLLPQLMSGSLSVNA
jgi:type I restriction enzyme S subunit